EDADDQPANPQAAEMAIGAQQSAGDGSMSAEAGGVHARLHDHAKEAEFSAAEGRAGSSHERLRGYELYSRRRSQPTRAFGGVNSRRSSQRSSGGALSHYPRHSRHTGRQGSPSAPLEIRRQASKIGKRRCHVVAPRSNARSCRILSSVTP